MTGGTFLHTIGGRPLTTPKLAPISSFSCILRISRLENAFLRSRRFLLLEFILIGRALARAFGNPFYQSA
jgi:hypothetical protein